MLAIGNGQAFKMGTFDEPTCRCHVSSREKPLTYLDPMLTGTGSRRHEHFHAATQHATNPPCMTPLRRSIVGMQDEKQDSGCAVCAQAASGPPPGNSWRYRPAMASSRLTGTNRPKADGKRYEIRRQPHTKVQQPPGHIQQ